jgi:AAA family ATP:ADP antiporter
MAVSPDRAKTARDFLHHPDPAVARAAVEALRNDRPLAAQLITHEWLQTMAQSPDPQRRALAACAIGVRGDHGTEALHRLLDDEDASVAIAAVRSAGALKNREYIRQLTRSLGNSRQRADAIAALGGFGEQICGTMGDLLYDEETPLRVRSQVPRVLKEIRHQSSVDVLIAAVGHRDLAVRAAVLKALNRLRERAPGLNFENHFVSEQIWQEARHYYELNAALQPFREENGDRRTARLLARTIEARLEGTIERLFRLLGLRYPLKEMHSAYRAVARRHPEEATVALEFLESTLEPDIKKILLPLLDAPENLHDHGRELFGVEPRTTEDAIRELIRSHDPWLVACAIAAAGELNLRNLAPEIHEAAAECAEDVLEVARTAEARLAA